jgi:acyl-CoA dehydrogenase
MAVETGWGFTIDRYATKEVREKYVKPAMEGKKFIGIASTEPGGGSDVAGIKSVGRKEGDEWILNGEKTFISGVYECKSTGGGYWVLVRTERADKPHKELTSFFVPIDSEGLELTEPYRDAGRGSLSTAGFVMHDVRVPESNMLGERGKGFYQTMEGFDNARLLIGASACGVTRRVLEESGKYVNEREVFGKKLASYEGISFEFADFYANLEMLKCTYQHVADMQDLRYKEEGMPDKKGKSRTYKPQEISKWISIIKWKAPHLAKDAADRAMHWLGAAGYTDEYILETAWRGVMSYCVGAEGGENIQKIVIARESLGDATRPY